MEKHFAQKKMYLFFTFDSAIIKRNATYWINYNAEVTVWKKEKKVNYFSI